MEPVRHRSRRPTRRSGQSMTGEDRSLVLWALSSLMVAEERITTKFSGLVGAYGTEEEATFLATQQVDEARHMQFYARFQDEVIADPQTIGAHVARAREQLSPAFSDIFDKALVAGARAPSRGTGRRSRQGGVRHHLPPGHRGHPRPDRLQLHLRVPRARGAARRIRRGLLEDPPRRAAAHRRTEPGSFARRSATDPALGDHVRQTLRSLLPAVAQALTPPDREGTDWDALGAERGRDPRLRGHGAFAPAQHRRSPARLAVTQPRPSLGRRAAAEGLATFALVFAGCGAIVADRTHSGDLGRRRRGPRLRARDHGHGLRDRPSLRRAHQPRRHGRVHPVAALPGPRRRGLCRRSARGRSRGRAAAARDVDRPTRRPRRHACRRSAPAARWSTRSC